MQLSELANAIDEHAALRRRQRLQPVGGPGDKVYPASYPGSQHVWEERRVPGPDGTLAAEPVHCVLVDSVQSQANRLEEALLDSVRRDGLELPYLTVSFAGTDVKEIGEITSLDAPHRVYDAIFRDSLLDGTPFMESELGVALKLALPASATALLEASPTALLYGAWHSQGQGGGIGSKFPRCIVSEIVGVGAVEGRRSAVRIDPLGTRKEIKPFRNKEGDWGFDKKALGSGASAVRPSEINHGSIITKIDSFGVTFDYAEQTAVVTLAGLRRLRFGNDERDRLARTYLAALGLLSLKRLDRTGYALRSRCDLVSEMSAPIELVRADGQSETVTLSLDDARKLHDSALQAARDGGFTLDATPTKLTPQEKLVTLVRLSRERALAGKGDDSED